MRLQRLDLTRYGMFTDHNIDFGPRVENRPDLHIVYGPNESGKSTALAAYLDLLFGIKVQSLYGFLHPYPSMRIGATLEVGGETRDLVRIKKPQNSLLDSEDKPIAEGVLASALGGIDREAYRTMFSLDDDTLEAGGKSILASKGDLGQLLFSASAGLADLSQSLESMQTEVDRFHRARARNTGLAELKAALADLKSRGNEFDTLASTYAKFIETRDTAKAGYDEAMAARTKTKNRMDEVQRLLDGLPRLAELRVAREELEKLEDLPEPPAEWKDQLPGLMEDETRLKTELAGIDGEIERLRNELGDITVDKAVFGLGDRIERLTEPEARYRTAEDIPNRQLDHNTVKAEIQGILKRLDQKNDTDPESLILSASTVGIFGDLIESRSGIGRELDGARREHAKARQELDKARATLDSMGGDNGAEEAVNPDPGILTETISTLRADDHGARKRLAERSKATQSEYMTERLSDLRPWDGDVEALARISVPDPARIEAWKTSVTKIQKDLDRHAGTVEQQSAQRDRQRAEIDAIKTNTGVIDDETAVGTRKSRDDAWVAHREALDARTAEIFEKALGDDDDTSDARLRQSTDVAKLRGVSQGLAITTVDMNGAIKLRDATESRLQAINQEIADAIQAMAVPSVVGLPADMSLARLEGWLGHRVRALETRAAIKDAEREIHNAEADGRAARERIIDVLGAAGVPHDKKAKLDTLLDLAQTVIEREKERRTESQAARKAAEECDRELGVRARDLELAQGADEEWKQSWTEAVSSCWLGDIAGAPKTGAVRQILTEIATLEPALEKQAGLAGRIQKMEADKEDFIKLVRSVIENLKGTLDQEKVLDAADELRHRLENARRQHEAQAGRIGGLEKAEARRRKITEQITDHQTRKDNLTGLFGVSTLAEVSGKLGLVNERAQLRVRKAGLEKDITEALKRSSFHEAETALEDADRELLQAEITELDGHFTNQDQRSQDLFAAHSKAADVVEGVGADASVARIDEERQTILLEIEDKALRYLRLKLGIAATEQALRAYRDKHRSTMMTEASNAFRTISREAYNGLSTQPDKDSEVLIGLVSGGGSKISTEMSKGTRFQLYLALRVAGYLEFARSGESVPFIADDIMETFDDFRAEEAFRLFGEMAKVGQVIYLTHHQHLCQIAQKVCPEVTVHELPGPTIAAQ